MLAQVVSAASSTSPQAGRGQPAESSTDAAAATIAGAPASCSRKLAAHRRWPFGRCDSACSCQAGSRAGSSSSGRDLEASEAGTCAERRQLEADAQAAREETASLRQQLAALLAQQQEEREAAAAAAVALGAEAERQRRRAEAAEGEAGCLRRLSSAAAAAQALAEAEAAVQLADLRLAAQKRRVAGLQEQVEQQRGVIATLADSRGDAFEERFHLRLELRHSRAAAQQAQRSAANLSQALQQQRDAAEQAVAAAREEGQRAAAARWQARVLELRKQVGWQGPLMLRGTGLHDSLRRELASPPSAGCRVGSSRHAERAAGRCVCRC